MTSHASHPERPRPTAGSRPRGLLGAAALALAAHAGLAALLLGGGDGAQDLADGDMVQITDIVFVEAPSPAPATAAPLAALAAPRPAPTLAEPATSVEVAAPAPAPVAPPKPAAKPEIATAAPTEPVETAAVSRPSDMARADAARAQGNGKTGEARPDTAASRTAAAGAPGGRAKAGVQYERRLLDALHANLVYPRLARLRGEQGEARLYLLIARDGQMLAHRLDASSGHAALDEAALDTARRSAPLPPLPADYPEDRLALVVPISFGLR